MASLQLLLFLGYFATAQAANALGCFNDYEKMFCRLAVQQCSQYTVDIQNSGGYGEYNCSLVKCSSEQCCCSVEFLPVPEEYYDVRAFKGEQEVSSTTMNILETLKPKTPKIVSVHESEGNFKVHWKTNMDHFPDKLIQEVAIFKKGDTEKVFKQIQPAIVDGLQMYEISSEQLEPDTAYMVSVRSRTTWNHLFSDRSEEFEFKTSIQQGLIMMWLVLGFSMFGIILVSFMYSRCLNFQKKWSELPKPQGLIVHPHKQQLYRPQPATISNISSDDRSVRRGFPEKITDPEELQLIMTGASHNCFFNSIPPPKHIKDMPLPVCLGIEFGRDSSLSTGISNHSYSKSLHKYPDQTGEENATDELQDDSRNSHESNTEDDQEKVASLFSGQTLCGTQVDSSYKPCKSDPKRSSYSEDTILCTHLGGSITPPSSLAVLEPLFIDQCSVGEDPFLKKMEQKNALTSEKKLVDECSIVGENEGVFQIPPNSFFQGLKCGLSLPGLQTPGLFHLMSSNTSVAVMVESDYKFV